MQRWEYKLIDTKRLPDAKWFKNNRISIEEAEKYLNQLGNEGWEIINLDFDGVVNDIQAFVGVAKRQKN